MCVYRPEILAGVQGKGGEERRGDEEGGEAGERRAWKEERRNAAERVEKFVRRRERRRETRDGRDGSENEMTSVRLTALLRPDAQRLVAAQADIGGEECGGGGAGRHVHFIAHEVAAEERLQRDRTRVSAQLQ